MSVHQALKDALGDPDGLGDRERPIGKVAREGAVLEIFHDVVRGITLPADGQQADNVSGSVQGGQFFDFSGKECPVESSVVTVDLDRNKSAGVFFTSHPDRTERAVSEASLEGVTGQQQSGVPGLSAECPGFRGCGVVLDLSVGG
jgi:hypothetical protein